MQQEIGVWTTAEGSTTAMLEVEGVLPGDEWKIPSWVSGALQGAAAGAATGAAAGPYGALIGAAAGGAIGAATSGSAPAAPPAATPGSPAGAGAKPPASGDAAARANVVAALQQFAAIVPTLVQLVASSGKGGKELGADGEERLEDSEWGPESFQGSWSIP
jgi:hypothetical protein